AIDQADRQSAVEIFARQDNVERIVGEHFRPIRQPLLVERLRVSRVERFDLVMQQQSLQARIQGRGVGRMITRQSGFTHVSRAPSPRASADTWPESMLPRSNC